MAPADINTNSWGISGNDLNFQRLIPYYPLNIFILLTLAANDQDPPIKICSHLNTLSYFVYFFLIINNNLKINKYNILQIISSILKQ